MKNKTAIEKAIAILAAVLLVVLVLTFAIQMLKPAEIEAKEYEAFGIGDKPVELAEKLDLEVPGEDATEEELIDFAVTLYETANENFKNAENASYMIKNVTTMQMLGMDVPIPGFRFLVKNADKLYYSEYSFVEEFKNEGGGISIQGLIQSIVGLFDTRYAVRKYTDATMDKTIVQRVADPIPTFAYNEEEGKYIYDVDWKSEALEEYEEDKIVYYADQDKVFEYTEQKITRESVKSAKVDYNEEEGFYRIEVELDTVLATTLTLPRLKASSGSEDAHYTKLVQVYEIWDNGYFRYFHAMDDWAGGPMGSASKIDFETTFYYDEYWTNIENYQYLENFGK